MSTPLDLSTHQRPDGSWVMTAAGEIDMSNAGVFAESLAQARAKAEERDGDGGLVVHLRAVEYLDTAGLTTLFANAQGIELIASPLIAPVLAISGLSDLVTVHGLPLPEAGSGPGRLRPRAASGPDASARRPCPARPAPPPACPVVLLAGRWLVSGPARKRRPCAETTRGHAVVRGQDRDQPAAHHHRGQRQNAGAEIQVYDT